jgi:hypothetical protein
MYSPFPAASFLSKSYHTAVIRQKPGDVQDFLSVARLLLL